jgi:hypothetical protein
MEQNSLVVSDLATSPPRRTPSVTSAGQPVEPLESTPKAARVLDISLGAAQNSLSDVESVDSDTARELQQVDGFQDMALFESLRRQVPPRP